MTADIEKLIRHNTELLSIKKELKNKGLVNNNRFTDSSKNYNNKFDHDLPKPLLFVSRMISLIMNVNIIKYYF